MREIKFRAWDTKENKMDVPRGLVVSIGLDGMVCVEMDDDGGKSGLWEHELPEYRTRFELMQYTGLKDKNGKEIYEGDVVGDSGCHYEVEFEGGMFQLAHSTPLIEWIYARKRQGIETEIIGNIYENPELKGE